MPHFDPFSIRPVERRCACPPPKRGPGEHTPECAERYKADLLGRKQQERDTFYDTPRARLN